MSFDLNPQMIVHIEGKRHSLEVILLFSHLLISVSSNHRQLSPTSSPCYSQVEHWPLIDRFHVTPCDCVPCCPAFSSQNLPSSLRSPLYCFGVRRFGSVHVDSLRFFLLCGILALLSEGSSNLHIHAVSTRFQYFYRSILVLYSFSTSLSVY